VQDRVASFREAVDRGRVTDVPLSGRHTSVPLPHFVVRVPRDEHDVMPASHELGHRACSNDSCPTRDEYFHATHKGRDDAIDSKRT